MRSDAATVDEYLDELPLDRRDAIERVRATILEHLPPGYEETMAWGMISYEVPLERSGPTYNGKPLVYVGLASQKNHMALYLTHVYADPRAYEEFRERYRASGKKLDMGKSCVLFKRLDDLPLDVVADAIAAVPLEEFVATVEAQHGGCPARPRRRAAVTRAVTCGYIRSATAPFRRAGTSRDST